MIRTRMAAPDAVGKGWIREAVLVSLSKNPSTLTSLARELDVAKSTVDYHIRGLLEKGLIEISETTVGRGGIVSKFYSLGRGAVVLLPTAAEEMEERRHLEEAFEAQTLSWAPGEDSPDGQEMRLLLYRLFLHLFKITRSQHQALLQEYGRRVGKIVAVHFTSRGRRATLQNAMAWMSKNSVASAELVDVPDSQSSVLMLGDCLGSAEHPGRACWFLEGLVEEIVRARLGSSYLVSRLENPGIPSCCLVVGRGRRQDSRFLREAILSSPMRNRNGGPTAGGR